jgi:hypothetical protein
VRTVHRGEAAVVTLEEALAEVDRALAEVPQEARAAAAGALVARAAVILASLAGTTTTPRRWSRAEDAAQAHGVDVAQLRRWARRDGVTWASWPTKRRLLVDVEAFDRWLSAGRFAASRRRNEGARRRTQPGVSALVERTDVLVDDRTRAGGR